MELSKRLKFIIENMDKTVVLADVGTDHGYIPLYATKNNLCKKAIAIDINKDPLDKARLNAILEGAGDEIEFRLGDGLKPIEKGEVEAVIIAGMGGNLIRDILEESKDKVSSISYLILVPAQNPEILREYLYNNDYEIICEDLCEEEGKYYELFKVRKKDGESMSLDEIYYEVSPKLLMQKHPLIKEYLNYKIENYNKILGFITESTVSAQERRNSIKEKINILTTIINYI
ncbi:MAG: SAM-dependent methyltransferase [Clostridium sp.]|nr:SAM-dependent methyltransferase [Clostridium sp.]